MTTKLAENLLQFPIDDNSPSDIADLLTIDEVAALLKVPKSWIYERTRRRGLDRLPYIKLGKYLRFEESGIRAYLNRNRKSA
ncbi:MAG TPA: helix-turn-helix domain-containing protein [Pyrinomonadaceae bacterium]|jgi:excisionase family DNA binding protein|nr:helix-turn-helix domain-containing protein [Pyrinomonadaceae bacterium]